MLDVEYPITIEGGGQHDVDMQLLAVNVDPGDRPINFTINSNCETDPEYRYVLNVKVNAAEKHIRILSRHRFWHNEFVLCLPWVKTQDVPQLIPLDTGQRHKCTRKSCRPQSSITANPKNEKTCSTRLAMKLRLLVPVKLMGLTISVLRKKVVGL